MKTSVEQQENVVVIHISGEVDMSSSPDLRKVLLHEVRQKRPKIIIDLSGVSYIDSSGLATLIECLQGVSKYKGTLIIVGLRPNVRDVFEIAKLDEVFDLRETVDEAMNA